MTRDSDGPSLRPRIPSGLSQFFVPPVTEKIADVLGRHLARYSDFESRVDGRFDRFKYRLSGAAETLEELEKAHDASLPAMAQLTASVASLQSTAIRLSKDVEKLTKLVTDIRITMSKYAGAAGLGGALLGYLISWLMSK